MLIAEGREIDNKYIKTIGTIKEETNGYINVTSRGGLVKRNILVINIEYQVNENIYYLKIDKGYRFRMGSQIEIHYNPEKPHQAVIFSKWNYYTKPLLSYFIFFVFSLIFCLFFY
jgi:hypothetical protein